MIKPLFFWVIGLIFLISSCDSTIPIEEVKMCTVDEDCLLVKDTGCCKCNVAINEKFEKYWERLDTKNNDQCYLVDCMPCETVNTAFCDEGICKVKFIEQEIPIEDDTEIAPLLEKEIKISLSEENIQMVENEFLHSPILKVIISLKDNELTTSPDDEIRKEAIRILQDEVISTLTEEEFTVHRRFTLINGFAGDLTREGFEKLKYNQNVKYIEIDRPVGIA